MRIQYIKKASPVNQKTMARSKCNSSDSVMPTSECSIVSSFLPSLSLYPKKKKKKKIKKIKKKIKKKKINKINKIKKQININKTTKKKGSTHSIKTNHNNCQKEHTGGV